MIHTAGAAMTEAEVARGLGAALALGLPAFPCRPDKRPATPHGFRDATADPNEIRDLWRLYPGPLVGVPTGTVAAIDVLDIDAPRHPEAVGWLAAHRARLRRTREHRTRSGGLHILFEHASGMRCSASRIAPGVDVRAEGGYVIWWPAAGCSVLCAAPPAPWPEWLLNELIPVRAPALRTWSSPADPPPFRAGSRYAAAALRSAAERVARAPIGARNSALNGEAYAVGRLVAAGLIYGQDVADVLAAAAVAAGLSAREIAATLRSALGSRGLL